MRLQVNSPDGSITEVAVCVGVTELSLNTTGCRPALAEPTSETNLTGVQFTPTV